MAFEMHWTLGSATPFYSLLFSFNFKMAAARLTRDNNRSAWGRLCKPDKHANAAQAQPREPASRERPWLGCSKIEPVNSGEFLRRPGNVINLVPLLRRLSRPEIWHLGARHRESSAATCGRRMYGTSDGLGSCR